MATKQCTDCGAQMATTARRCPVCGGGVAASDFGMFAFLGVLLLGIGLASGLIPLHRQPPGPEVASTEVVVPARPENQVDGRQPLAHLADDRRATTAQQPDAAGHPASRGGDRPPSPPKGPRDSGKGAMPQSRHLRRRATSSGGQGSRPSTPRSRRLRHLDGVSKRVAGYLAPRDGSGESFERRADLHHPVRLDRTLTCHRRRWGR